MSLTKKRHSKHKRIPYSQWSEERKLKHSVKSTFPTIQRFLSMKHMVPEPTQEERNEVSRQYEIEIASAKMEINRFKRLKSGMVT